MPPVVVLFVAAVLVLTQLFHLLFPGRITYLRRLILATLGVALGELAGGRFLPSGPRLGDLHPLWDAAFVTALQLLGNRFLRTEPHVK
ncbi:MAG TPA: hypothetical protein VG329_12250 [Candidatus Dormibacteraeota bacterium]|jgi:hypothetical protein|nr:hypothetical protein [Candidatus Dormibacteraeota bacterium]